jgi:hypothetical protein
MKRSIGMAIVLSIITCGIYMLYWLYQLLTSYYQLTNQPSNAGMDIVLSIITCGIYGYYLAYKIGKMESSAYRDYGMHPKDDSILYLVLAIFGFAIIVYAIAQSNLNALVDSGNGPDQGQNQQYGNI